MINQNAFRTEWILIIIKIILEKNEAAIHAQKEKCIISALGETKKNKRKVKRGQESRNFDSRENVKESKLWNKTAVDRCDMQNVSTAESHT